MEERKDVKKRWIKCSVIGFLIAFVISMIILEGDQIDLIQGNSYYLSSVSIFLETILYPIKYCIMYSIVTEIICQIMFWITEAIRPKEKEITQKNKGYIIIPIVANIISFIISIIVFLSNFTLVF